MTIHLTRWLFQRRWIVAAVGLPILLGLWWAFRPEKLWINEKVSEAAPFDTSGEPQPVVTGRFEGNAHQISGRATIYKRPNQEAGREEYLRLSDFTAPNAPDTHVVLGRSESDLDRIDLGPLKSNQGEQNYDLPAATDLSKYHAVVIYSEQSHAVLGLAKLEPF
jgi:hypothetical protein